MQLTIRARLDYAFPEPTDLLLQLEAAANIDEQWVDRAHIAVPDCEHFVRVAGHDGIGAGGSGDRRLLGCIHRALGIGLPDAGWQGGGLGH